MSNSILHKRSSTASAVPTSGSLVVGELAINTADGKVYTKKADTTVVEISSNNNHTHAASAITSGTLDIARIPTGTTSSTVCIGNDGRLSDARTPTAHTHGNITNAGAIGSTANLPLITTTSGVITTGSFGTAANTFCQGNDGRLSDARTPTAHTHGNITNAGAIGSTSGLPIITTTSGVLTTGSFGTSAGTFCQGNDSRLSDKLSNATNSTQNGYFGDIFLYDDATPSHYLGITNSANLTAARTLSLNVNDADRTVSLSGNLTVSGAATVSGTNSGDQTITLTGDVTGSGTGSFAATLATVATAGTYRSVTVDAKGRVTSGTNPTTLSGYGITDAASSTHTHGNITNAGAIGSTSGLPIITTTSGVLTTGSFGTTAGTFCQGNDGRLSDARTPTSHTHGNITNAGAIGSTANLPLITTTSGVVTTGSFGTAANTFCQGNDGRLSDARTPTAHNHSASEITSGTFSTSLIPNLDASKITSGTIDAARLPSYVDDVLEYAALANFPGTGETGKIYVAIDTNKTYRWSGSAYVQITSGAVDSVAGRTGVVTLTKSDVGLGNVDNTADANKSVSSAATWTTARTLSFTGDVTGSGSVNGSANVATAMTIANGAVSYAKIQNVSATNRILGRSTAGAGVVEEITCTAAGRSLIAGADAAAQRTTLGLGTLATQSGTFSGTSSGTNTGDQTITLTGDVTGSGTGSFAATLATVATAGTYKSVTVDVKGRVTAGTNPTTLSGYGITDALSNATNSTQNGYFGDIFLYDDATPSHYLGITNSANLTAARTLSINVNDANRTVSLSGNLTVSADATVSGTNTGNQTITLTGDVTGSGTGSFAATIASNAVTFAKIQNSAAAGLSVVGRSTNSAGAFAEITAGSDNQVLRRSGTSVGFGTIATDGITNSAVTYAKIQNVSATDRLLGRSTAGAGVVEEITCTSAARSILDDATVADMRTTLQLGTLATQSGTFSGTSSGTNTGDQTITLTGDVTGSGTGSFAATIASNAVTFAKMQKVSTDILLGNDGIGDNVQAITCTLAGRNLLDDADAAAQRTTLGLGTLATLNAVGTSQIVDANVTTAKLANNAVTFAKFQTMTANKLVGTIAGNTTVQEISLGSGAGGVIMSGLGNDTLQLAASGVTANTYRSVTVNTQGIVTAGTNPTTLSGYGITDALSNATNSTQSGYFGDIFLYDDATPSHYLGITNSANLTAARTLSINVNDANRSISLVGDIVGVTNYGPSGDETGHDFSGMIMSSKAGVKRLRASGNPGNTLFLEGGSGIGDVQIGAYESIAGLYIDHQNDYRVYVSGDLHISPDGIAKGDGSIEATGYIYSSSYIESAGAVEAGAGYRIGSGAISDKTASYTLTASDNGKIITVNSSSATTITVGTAVGAKGFSCTIIQLGTGQVTIAASSTTLNSYNGLKIVGQHGAASIVAYATNTFNVSGNLTT